MIQVIQVVSMGLHGQSEYGMGLTIGFRLQDSGDGSVCYDRLSTSLSPRTVQYIARELSLCQICIIIKDSTITVTS